MYRKNESQKQTILQLLKLEGGSHISYKEFVDEFGVSKRRIFKNGKMHVNRYIDKQILIKATECAYDFIRTFLAKAHNEF